MWMQRTLVGLWMMLLAAGSAPAMGETAPTRTVALTGHAAPGAAAGLKHKNFLTPSLNAAGHVAFAGKVSGSGVGELNDECLWSEGGGELALIAREFDQAPGTSAGAQFDEFFDLELTLPLNSSGSTAFRIGLTGAGIDPANSAGLWVGGAGDLPLVVRMGDAAPGVEAGTLFGKPKQPALNDGGHVAFKCGLVGPTVTDANNAGIWSNASGTLALVARKGNPTGMLPGIHFAGLGDPVMNNAGHMAFLVDLGGAGVDDNNNDAIFAHVANGLTLVAREGDSAPGLAAVLFGRLDEAVINHAGHVSFRSSLKGPGITSGDVYAMWVQRGVSLEAVAVTGDSAPGTPPGTQFDQILSEYVLNASGTVAFAANLAGIGVTNEDSLGLWTAGEEGLNLVARRGDTAPGTPPGMQFSDFVVRSIDASGHVLITARLLGSAVVSNVNDQGIWAQDETGAVQLVARTGDTLEVAPGDKRTIMALHVAETSGSEAGRPVGFNDAGQVAFRAEFTDGTEGIFVTIGPDADGDRVNDQFDNCPGDANAEQADEDGDGLGDACEDAADADEDGSDNDGAGDDVNPADLAVDACGTCGPGAAGALATAVSMMFLSRRSWRRGRRSTARGGEHPSTRALAVRKLLAMGLFAACSVPALGETAPVRVVVLSGEQAVGAADGESYLGFGAPSINASGHVAFIGFVNGPGVNTFNDEAMWSEGGGELALVAREFDPAPGTPAGVRFNTFESELVPLLNGPGRTAFRGNLAGSGIDSSNSSGIWFEGDGGLTLAAREGNAAPGVEAGVVFLFAGVPAFNDEGQMAFSGSLTGPAVTADNNTGIWSDTIGPLALIARKGSNIDVLPGLQFGSISPPKLTAAGHVAFRCKVAGSGVNTTNDDAMFLHAGGALTLVAREGSAAPGLANVLVAQMSQSPMINQAGDMAFRSRLSGPGVDSSNDQAMWIHRNGALELVARTGDPAPGTLPGTNIGTIHENYALNASGTVAFAGVLTGFGVTTDNDFAMWTAGQGDPVLVARKGDPAPSTPPGTHFGGFSVRFINASGHVAFQSQLTGSSIIAQVNDEGIWAQDETGTLRLVARTGDTLEVSPGDVRTISFLQMAEIGGGEDGRPTGLNDAGQVAFRAFFTDGTDGIFVTIGPDADGDRVNDHFDNCPGDSNTEQADEDGDGIGDACDNCAAAANSDQTDANGDGIGDACEEPVSDDGSGDGAVPADLTVDACGTCGPGTAPLPAGAISLLLLRQRRRWRLP